MARINVGQNMTILYKDDQDLEIKGFDARLLCYSDTENLLIFKREDSEIVTYGGDKNDADEGESTPQVKTNGQQVRKRDTDAPIDSEDGSESYGEDTEELDGNGKQLSILRRSEGNLSLSQVSIRQVNNDFPCKSCDKVFSSSFTRERHRREKHTSTKIYSCERCSKIYNRKYLLTQHNIKCIP